MDRRILSGALGLLLLLHLSPVSAGPIHDAAGSGDVDHIKQLIDQGANIEERDETRETPLFAAALSGQTAVVRMLIERGADTHARNDRGMTPLHAAAFGGHLTVVRHLIDRGAKVNDSENQFIVTPLHVAAEENRKAVAQALLAAGASVDTSEINGYTPLSRAGWRENWKIFDLLLEAGAVCQPLDLTGEWLFNECTKRSK